MWDWRLLRSTSTRSPLLERLPEDSPSHGFVRDGPPVFGSEGVVLPVDHERDQEGEDNGQRKHGRVLEAKQPSPDVADAGEEPAVFERGSEDRREEPGSDQEGSADYSRFEEDAMVRLGFVGVLEEVRAGEQPVSGQDRDESEPENAAKSADGYWLPLWFLAASRRSRMASSCRLTSGRSLRAATSEERVPSGLSVTWLRSTPVRLGGMRRTFITGKAYGTLVR